MPTDQTTSSGARKAAIFTLMLNEEATKEIFKHLDDDEIQAIVSEVAALKKIPSEEGEKVLEEYHHMWKAAEYASRGGVDYAKKLLNASLGTDRTRRVLERVSKSFGSTVVFTALKNADPQQLSRFILAEHPQTIALILSHLKAGQAAEFVELLPEQLRVEVITRMATLDEISPDVIKRISSVIEQRLKTVAGSTHHSYGGVRAVAELLNRLNRATSQPVLESIESRVPDLAVSIRDLMFTFDDLVNIEDTAMREIVQRADKKNLTVALKGASEAIQARFLQNMSKRAGDLIREEMEMLGAVRLKDVEKAQQEIVGIARKLEEEGLLVTGAAAGEAYVA